MRKFSISFFALLLLTFFVSIVTFAQTNSIQQRIIKTLPGYRIETRQANKTQVKEGVVRRATSANKQTKPTVKPALSSGAVKMAAAASGSCPADIAVNNDAGKCGAVVNYTVTPPDDTIPFYYTGTPQSFIIPSGVTSITALAYGARGADSYGPGGNGGLMKATFTVTSNQTLTIYVGGRGSGTNGGYNGGGNSSNGFFGSGGGGGGSSDIRTGGTTLNDRILVGAVVVDQVPVPVLLNVQQVEVAVV